MHISVFFLHSGHSVPLLRFFEQEKHKHIWPQGMQTDFTFSVMQNRHLLFLRASTLISTVISKVGPRYSGLSSRSFRRYLIFPGEASINSCYYFLLFSKFMKSLEHSLNLYSFLIGSPSLRLALAPILSSIFWYELLIINYKETQILDS